MNINVPVRVRPAPCRGRRCAAGSIRTGRSPTCSIRRSTATRCGSSSRSEEYARRYAALRDKMRAHEARCRHRAGRPEPLELRRRHDLADRPLGMARDLLLCGGAARGRADADLLHGRHACGGGAPPGRAGARRRAPEPRRPLRRGDGRAHQGARTRARPRIGLVEIDPRHKDYMPVNQYNDLRDGLPGRRDRVHAQLHPRARRHQERGRARLRAPAGVLCQRAMEAMVAAAKPGATESDLRGAAGRRHPAGRRRHRFPHHRLDPDGEPGDVLRQSAPVRAQARARATSSSWSWPRAIAATRRRSARRSASASRPRW